MVLGPGTLRARFFFSMCILALEICFLWTMAISAFSDLFFCFFPFFAVFYLALLCVYLVCFHKTWCKWFPGGICFHSYTGYVVITCISGPKMRRVSWLWQNHRWTPLITVDFHRWMRALEEVLDVPWGRFCVGIICGMVLVVFCGKENPRSAFLDHSWALFRTCPGRTSPFRRFTVHRRWC